MSFTVIAAIIAFVVLFGAWVILPSRLKKYHDNKVEVEE
jgi:hypothetical protein